MTCKMLGTGGRKRNRIYYCVTGEGGFGQPSIQLWLLVTDIEFLRGFFNTFCLIKFKSLSVKLGPCVLFFILQSLNTTLSLLLVVVLS